jgi:8-amino-7-oxononanoate synthase
MNDFNQELNFRLEEIQAAGLLRRLRPVAHLEGAHLAHASNRLLNFASNDYLGLATSEPLKEGARRALEKYGAGSGASRLVTGSLVIHHDLEQALAEYKGCEAALTFSSGYAAAIGSVTSLLGAGDTIITDQLIHASLVDAARLCKAYVRIFRHNDLNQLEEILRETDTSSISALSGRRSRTLIVTESVFSMDGDLAPLQAIVQLKEKYGAWLMVDEAHATGLFGAKRRGCVEAAGVGEQVEIQLGTLSKALGASGGFICGSRVLIDYLINRARSFIFSTAPNPAASGAALEAVQVVQSPEGEKRASTLWKRVQQLQEALKISGVSSPIFPLITGGEELAVQQSLKLLELGFLIPAIRHPSVPRGKARLRVTLGAAHSEEQVEQLIFALRKVGLCDFECLTP